MFDQQKIRAENKISELNTEISGLDRKYQDLHKMLAKKLSIEDNLPKTR
jgi:hypothetical protein